MQITEAWADFDSSEFFFTRVLLDCWCEVIHQVDDPTFDLWIEMMKEQCAKENISFTYLADACHNLDVTFDIPDLQFTFLQLKYNSAANSK